MSSNQLEVFPAGDVHATLARAYELRALADVLEGTSSRVAAQAHQFAYEGPAANRYRHVLHERQGELRREAMRLRTLAERLAQAAGSLGDQQRSWQRRRAELDRQAAEERTRQGTRQ